MPVVKPSIFSPSAACQPSVSSITAVCALNSTKPVNSLTLTMQESSDNVTFTDASSTSWTGLGNDSFGNPVQISVGIAYGTIQGPLPQGFSQPSPNPPAFTRLKIDTVGPTAVNASGTVTPNTASVKGGAL